MVGVIASGETLSGGPGEGTVRVLLSHKQCVQLCGLFTARVTIQSEPI